MKNTPIWYFTGILLFVTLILACSSESDTPKTELPSEPGTYELSVQMDTTLRWFTLIIPPDYNPTDKTPLILAFHPGNANMADFNIAMKGLKDFAAEEKWVVAFPNGRNLTDNRTGECSWNATHCCGLPYLNNVDDVGFVRELINVMLKEYNIDEERIYATGRSNGGMLVHRLGAEMSDVFTAIAPFSSTGGGMHDDDSPEQVIEPNGPIPILMMHGLNDQNVKFYGGLSSNMIRTDISFARTTKIWLDNNGCNEMLADTTILDSENGKTWVVKFSSCQNNAEVIAISCEKSGHQIPRITNSGFDGQAAIFDFFQMH